MDVFTQLGVGGIFVILVLREVFGFLEKKRSNGNGTSPSAADVLAAANLKKTIYEISRQMDDLYEWHRVADEDGVKVWYVRRSLETAMRDLADNIKAQTLVLTELMAEMRSVREDMGRLDSDLEMVKSNKVCANYKSGEG